MEVALLVDRAGSSTRMAYHVALEVDNIVFTYNEKGYTFMPSSVRIDIN